jgi:hypothetical protein
MTRLKVQSKVFLLLACLLCYSAYNPATAQEVIPISPITGGIVQDPAPILVAPDEPILVAPDEPELAPVPKPVPTAPTYSADNPFSNSQYTDLADLTELLLQEGYNVDQYFYSEGFSTGMDGTLGNEYVCFRDDANKVYIGRSDVCRDREMDSTYSYIQIDKMDWTSGFPDLTVLQTGDLLGDTSQYWDGCYNLNQGWGGYSSPGGCPTINDTYDGQINFSYVQKTLTNTAALNLALQEAGIEVTGYRYEWSVKNADANRTDTGNGRNTADPFQVTIKIYDESGYSVYEKTYDYSYWMDWTRFSGEETFEDPFDASTLSEVQLSITGKDIGFWAGYYGPEFREPSIKLNYRTTGSAAEDTTVEDVLIDTMCSADPLYDPACPGYNDAMLAEITGTTTLAESTGYDDGTGVNDTSTMTGGIDITGSSDITGGTDPTGATASTTGSTDAAANDGSSTADATGTPDPVAEATGTTVAEATVAADPVAEATESATAETAASSSPTKSAGPGLNANQLAALDAAQAASANAESVAGDAASTSAGVGLSESGGVSSSLTSVDPTGSTNSLGGVGSNTFGGSSGSGSSGGGMTASIGSTGSDSGSDDGSGSNTGMDSNGQVAGLSTGFDDDLSGTGGITVDQDSPEQQLASIQESALSANELPKFDLIADIINQVTQAAITKAVDDAEEVAEESAEESFESQNAKEDALVEAARNGSDDEDAQAALLGYNPNFRAYQQPQMPGGDIYNDQGIYEDQKTYDNPRAGLFNGASDALHREMVRSQYERY